jgi:hypothetical protein
MTNKAKEQLKRKIPAETKTPPRQVGEVNKGIIPQPTKTEEMREKFLIEFPHKTAKVRHFWEWVQPYLNLDEGIKVKLDNKHKENLLAYVLQHWTGDIPFDIRYNSINFVDGKIVIRPMKEFCPHLDEEKIKREAIMDFTKWFNKQSHTGDWNNIISEHDLGRYNKYLSQQTTPEPDFIKINKKDIKGNYKVTVNPKKFYETTNEN